MQKTLLLIWIAFIFLMMSATAQDNGMRVEVKAGITHGNWRGQSMDALNSIVQVGDKFVQQRALTGYSVGVGVNLPVGDNITIQPGLQYAMTGTQLRGNLGIKGLELLGINASAQLQQHRVELPVMVKVKVAEGLEIVAGPQASYTMANQLRIRGGIMGINLVNSRIDVGDYFQPLQASAVGGIQYSLSNGIGIQALYEHGLTRQIRNGGANVYGHSARVGLTFGF